MQIRGAGLLLLVSLSCSTSMAQPDMRISADLGALTPAQRNAIAEASEVMREFMLTFNAQDPDRWAQTLCFHMCVLVAAVW